MKNCVVECVLVGTAAASSWQRVPGVTRASPALQINALRPAGHTASAYTRCEYIPCSCFDETSPPTRRLSDFLHFFQSDHLNETPSTVSFTEVLFRPAAVSPQLPPKAPTDAHKHI